MLTPDAELCRVFSGLLGIFYLLFGNCLHGATSMSTRCLKISRVSASVFSALVCGCSVKPRPLPTPRSSIQHKDLQTAHQQTFRWRSAQLATFRSAAVVPNWFRLKWFDLFCFSRVVSWFHLRVNSWLMFVCAFSHFCSCRFGSEQSSWPVM